MNLWHDVSISRITTEEFLAVIEIGKGSKQKYELDKESGALILDRILFTSMQYPANYGFIPKTLGNDNDPLDVLVLCTEQLAPLCLVKCRPIGVIEMIDDNQRDEKIIAVPVKDPVYGSYTKMSDISKHRLEEMRHFFKVYKNLENTETIVYEVKDETVAKMMILDALALYEEVFEK